MAGGGNLERYVILNCHALDFLIFKIKEQEFQKKKFCRSLSYYYTYLYPDLDKKFKYTISKISIWISVFKIVCKNALAKTIFEGMEGKNQPIP